MKNPIEAFHKIRQFFITYLETAFRIGDDEIQAMRRELLEQSGTLFNMRVEHIDGLPLIELAPRRWGVVVHPFWSRDGLMSFRTLVADFETDLDAPLEMLSTFDLVRRMGELIPMLRSGSDLSAGLGDQMGLGK